jgi:hypothetical protein
MKIPKKVWVMGVPYEVSYDENVAASGSTIGETHLVRGKIFLKPSLPRELLEQTFLHEVMHACYFQVGLREFKEINEEQFVNAMTNVLYDTIKTNKLNFLA